MSLPAAYLAKPLSRPLRTNDGGILATVDDACRYMTGSIVSIDGGITV